MHIKGPFHFTEYQNKGFIPLGICLYELTVCGKTFLRASLIVSAFSILIVATRTSLQKLLDPLHSNKS